MNVYHIGQLQSEGTYFFWSDQQRAWVVANLDWRRASRHDRLVTLQVREHSDMHNDLEHHPRAGLGQDDDDKWLVDFDDAMPLLRDYPGDGKVLMVYEKDGTQVPYGAGVVEELAAVLRIQKKRVFGEDAP